MNPPSHSRGSASAKSQENFSRALAFHVQLDDISTFTPPASDIFIVSFMKSGTTLMQQLLYQLLVSDISQVVPFLEAHHLTGIQHSTHPYRPRVWKSHAAAHKFCHLSPTATPPQDTSRGPRFIYCFREGRQAIRSHTGFALDWLATSPIEGDDVRNETYRKISLNCYLGLDDGPDGQLVSGTPLYDWFNHVRSWLDSKHTALSVHLTTSSATSLCGWPVNEKTSGVNH